MKLSQKILIATAALAAIPSLAAPPSQSSDQLATQISVTREATDQVLTKMKNAASAEVVGANPDFVVKAEAFNAKVEAAMRVYETKLRDRVLKPASFYVDRLNAIQNSKAYTPDQKRAILNDQINIAKNVFKDLSKEYATAVEELYALDFPSQAGIKITKIDGQDYSVESGSHYFLKTEISSENPLISSGSYTVKCERDVDSCYLAYSKGKPMQILEATVEPIRKKIFRQVVREGCLSASCLALYSSHRVSYLNLVKQDLNRPIAFNAGGDRLFISGSALVLNAMKHYLTLQPGESDGLPFEVSDREFADVKERMPLLTELKGLLLAETTGFFRSYQCNETRVSQLKEQLCRTAVGCLRAEEKDALVKAIENSPLDRTQARLDCLETR